MCIDKYILFGCSVEILWLCAFSSASRENEESEQEMSTYLIAFSLRLVLIPLGDAGGNFVEDEEASTLALLMTVSAFVFSLSACRNAFVLA